MLHRYRYHCQMQATMLFIIICLYSSIKQSHAHVHGNKISDIYVNASVHLMKYYVKPINAPMHFICLVVIFMDALMHSLVLVLERYKCIVHFIGFD